jgi:enterochelin esterase-like enzyme
MKTILLILLIVLSQTAISGNFGSFLNYVNLVPLPERQSKVDSFMKTNPVIPAIDNGTSVYFIYKGQARSAMIAGDFTGWSPTISMKQLSGTDLFYYITHFESNARIEYKLVIDDNWMLDPKNPNSFKGGMGTNSELKMPGYVAPPEILFYAVIPHGTISDTSFYSPDLKNSRNVKIYLPSGYNRKKEYPVILFHDGLEFITLADITNVLDYLIAHNEIEPVIGVFVPPVDRTNEYAGDLKDTFTNFIVKELMPEIDRKFSTAKTPQKRAIIGISDGGNISLYMGMKHPEVFGKIAAMSSDVQDVISDGIKKNDKLSLEFYMDLGLYDIPVLVPMVNDFIRILQKKNYSYQFKTWPEGHSWGNWKSHVSIPLRQFFSPQ